MAVAKWLSIVAMWEDAPGKVDDTNGTFRWALHARMDDLQYQNKYKGLSSEDFEKESQSTHQAGCV